MDRRVLQNPPKITLHGNCFNTPEGLERFPRCHFKDIDNIYIFNQKMHFLIKYHFAALHNVEIKIHVLGTHIEC